MTVRLGASNTACQPIGTDVIVIDPLDAFYALDAENRRRCERYVCLIQGRLDKAVADNDKEKIRWYVHILSKRSNAVKILSIYHVTVQNLGRYTSGIDGLKMVKDAKAENNRKRKALLETINIKKKPSPIRRIFIPKPNGKQRPLGIPTIADRINQDILRITLEPITEYYASDNSYGFRPHRNCHDAIEHLYRKLSQGNSRQWIMEGDIKGCFDHISHSHIIDTLKSWYVPDATINIIKQMLKAKVFSDNELHEVESGTPQGGILSPMLANVALTALDDHCEKHFGNKQGHKQSHKQKDRVINPIVRYADDFVIVSSTQQEAEGIREKISENLSNIGLELSMEKSRITHIAEGFDFLGFNIRKYEKKSPKSKQHKTGKLLIKPQKEKVRDFLHEIKMTLASNSMAKSDTVIKVLNPMLQGFGTYYRHAVSQNAFSYIDHVVWEKLWKWAKRRHPTKSSKWVMKRYFTTGKRKWNFMSETDAKTDAKTGGKLLVMARIPIVRYRMIKHGMRVHASDGQTREYWKQREYRDALSQVYSSRVGKLYRRQMGKCLACGQPITQGDISESQVQTHHIIPRAKGGTDELNNLRLHHMECHYKVHTERI